MTRKELYESIVKFGIQEKIKKYYKRNYTNCTNKELTDAIAWWSNVVENKVSDRDILLRLINTLHSKKFLTKNEVEQILK